jgi:hypothetical protein
MLTEKDVRELVAEHCCGVAVIVFHFHLPQSRATIGEPRPRACPWTAARAEGSFIWGQILQS